MQEIKQEDFFDLKEFFYLLKRYKFLIVFIVVLFTAGAFVYSYLATSFYKTNATVEIGETGKAGGAATDILSQALGIGSGDEVDTDVLIIKSRYMISNAIKNHDFQDRYFAVNKFKKFEIYGNPPFKVVLKKGEGIPFEIIPVSKNSFKLIVKYTDPVSGKKVNTELLTNFGKEIKNNVFDIVIYKTKPLKYSKYIYIKQRFIDLVKNIQSKLNVSRMGQKVNMINIEYIDNVPKRDALITNLIAKTFIKDTIKQKTQQASQLLAFVTKQLNKITRELAKSEVKLEEFKKKTGIVDVGLDSQMLLQKLSDLDTQLTQLKLKKETIDFVIKHLINTKNAMLISAGALDDPELQQMISKLQTLILERNALLIQYTPKHPKVIAIDNQIRDLKAIIFNRIYNLKNAIDKQYQLLSSIKSRYLQTVKKLPENERKLIDLERNYLVNKKIYEYLYEKKVSAEIAKASTISKNRIIDTALIPSAPFKPKKKLIIVIGFVLGIIFAIIVVILIDFLSTKIKSIEEIERHIKLPILGLIPHFKKKGNVVINSPKSRLTEAFRTLRTNIEFIPTTNKSKIISVTSTVGGEGKSTVASNLGIVYSMANKKTLVINLDMRKPSLHQIFNVENKKGISNVLAGHETIDNVIEKTDKDNLYIIPSGPIPPNPAELIQSENLWKSLRYLREKFDVIILDTPPIGIVADAVHVLKHSDVNLYLIRLNYSKKDFLKHINRTVEFYQVKNIGLVINDVKDKTSSYGYNYGYGYYSDEK